MEGKLLLKIQSDLKLAQLDHDETRISTLRLLLSEITYTRIQKGEELSEAEIISAIQKEVKKRKEAAQGFRQGDREEQAQKEEAEAEILGQYLPEQLTDIQLEEIVDVAIAQTGAKSKADMGKVIGLVMNKAGGQVEGARVSAIVKEKLGEDLNG